MKFSRSPLITLAAATLLAAPISAASSSAGAVPNLSSAAKSASQAEASKTANTASNTDSGDTASNAVSATGSDASTTGAQTGKSIQSSSVIITGSGSTASASGTIPTITGGSSATTGGALPTGLPSITGAYVIVAPSVPPTSNAPYMQVSSMPEGTVFIAVGAILGFLALSVLLWRALVAWSLHRSVKRAAAAQYSTDIKTPFRTPPAPFYKYSDRDSTISLGALGGKKDKKSGRPPTAPGAASASSLFFSPTAGAAGASLTNPGNRGSNYLPAGYYAAGASQPGNGQGMTHIGSGHGGAISLSNLGPARDGYARARSMGTTPPDSPAFRPQSSGAHGHAYGASRSTLNLNVDGEVRAPSAYLDDLFDGENAPPVPGHGRNESSPHRF